tara:strand:+ start:2749 stop:3381 length:633 start_codon:yes stop_codon:yes gene_type:complete
MNINHSLKSYQSWFDQRNLREKLLVFALSWALIYALFSLFLFRTVDTRNSEITGQIKKTQNEITSWKTQLDYLKEIPKSPLYKEWLAQNQQYESLKSQYKHLIGKAGPDKWDQIIKTILSSYPNIIIEKIENDPEKHYQTTKIESEPDTIFQQQMKLTVLGNFQDIVGYLSSLEKAMPNIHWDTLNYEVTEYPLARVAMEFSVLYEKTKF